ncbi:bifunctional riboflavin kinase/FAD synthetase [Orbaceae bacterium ESL0727]|nr:bifunctional riboflavin kinase/FAD synthetase [Orbaceae bacterium ESL0727]
MKIIRGIENLHHQFEQCAVTLGNFDGVHLGHQKLIEQLVAKSKTLNLPSVVILFEPQPLEFFKQDQAPARLTSFQEKLKLIAQLGVDYVLAVPFSQTFANLSADDFIQDWLINRLQARYIIIGDDFRFGAGRKGSAELLSYYADNAKFAVDQKTTQAGFTVESMPTFILHGANNLRVSSTAVREALQADDFVRTRCLLGRDYRIQGRVIHGNALARQLGFPTANILLHRKKPALQGVYLVQVRDLCADVGGISQTYYGIANIGIRPTINGKTPMLEVNIFNFSADIYGHYLTVQFIQKLRDEQKFSSLDALKEQIGHDVAVAKKIISAN